MITLATFTTPEEAHLLRSQLESAGIPSFLHSEYSIQNMWLHSNLLGGVRVQIAESDLEAAHAFLNAELIDPPTDPSPAKADLNSEGELRE